MSSGTVGVSAQINCQAEGIPSVQPLRNKLFSNLVRSAVITAPPEPPQPTTIQQSNGEKRPIRFNKSKTEASKSLFGSLRERIRVSIERIAKYFPSGLYVDADSISGINQYTAENVSYDVKTNITSFTLQSSKIYNPFDIELKEPSNGVIDFLTKS